MTEVFVFFISHWMLSAFAQSFFLHRYAAHGYFTLNRFWEKFFYLFTMAVQGPSFLNPRAYAILHRMHHAYSDTPDDPHSPVIIPNIFKMMWRTADIYDGISRNNLLVKEKFTQTLTLWPTMEKISNSWYYRIGTGALFVPVYYALVPAGQEWLYLLLPIHWLMGPIHGAIVNWAGHKVGYRNYPKTHDNSKNSLWLDFLILGELYQNNHHARANNPNFARRWFEMDITWQIIRLLAWGGIVKLSKTKAPLLA